MIHIIHGSDTVSSRNALLNLRSNYPKDSVLTIPKDSSFSNIAAVFNTNSMFGETILVVMERWKTDPFLSSEELLSMLRVKSDNVHVLVWVGQKLRSNHKLLSLVKTSGNGTVREFTEKRSKEVFALLDCLGGKRSTQAYQKLVSLLSSGESAVGILAMMAFSVRNMLMCLTNSPAFESLHPFVRKKTKSQANNFTQDKLLEVYKNILEIDAQLKSSSTIDDKVVLMQLVDKFLYE